MESEQVNRHLKEYPCAEFEKFISESGRYFSTLEDHEFDDYIKLFRMITIQGYLASQ